MIYYANPCSPATVDAMEAGLLGYIDTPAQGNVRPAGVDWCADNGAFSDRWDAGTWWVWLQENAHAADSCRFATAPDVVGDYDATVARALPWLERIRGLGYPVALVAQNGMERSTWDPWDHIDALFLGGSLECVPCRYVFREARKPDADESCPRCRRLLTEWKLGAEAANLTAVASSLGKWVHMGRVNSRKRLQYAEHIGCDSADGTYLTFGPDKNLPTLLGWLAELQDQPALLLA